MNIKNPNNPFFVPNVLQSARRSQYNEEQNDRDFYRMIFERDCIEYSFGRMTYEQLERALNHLNEEEKR